MKLQQLSTDVCWQRWAFDVFCVVLLTAGVIQYFKRIPQLWSGSVLRNRRLYSKSIGLKSCWTVFCKKKRSGSVSLAKGFGVVRLWLHLAGLAGWIVCVWRTYYVFATVCQSLTPVHCFISCLSLIVYLVSIVHV
jgi:hypothetical protein